MKNSKLKIFSFFHQRRINFWLNFLAIAFSFSLLAFHFASPVSAQNLLPNYNDVPGFENFAFKGPDATVGSIFSSALKYVFIFAGLALFIYLIAGGFQLLTSIGDPAGVSAGGSKIMHAFIGFLIIFASYWLMQIIEVIFGMTIL